MLAVKKNTDLITDEDKMHNFPQFNITPIPGSVPAAIDYLYRVIALWKHNWPPRGANMAATFLAEDNGWWEFDGKKRIFRATLFFYGSPPFSSWPKIFASGGRLGPVRTLRIERSTVTHQVWHWSTFVIWTRCYIDHGKGHEISCGLWAA